MFGRSPARPAAGCGALVVALLFASDVGAQIQWNDNKLAPASPPATPLGVAPAVALPAGCPSISANQCGGLDPAAPACTADMNKFRAYCAQLGRQQWGALGAVARKLVIPVDAPNELFKPMRPGQEVARSKYATASAMNRPAARTSISGTAQRKPATPAAAVTSLSITQAAGGGGSMATMKLADRVATIQRVSSAVSQLAATPTGAAGVAKKLERVDPDFVTLGFGVATCEDYVYKRWGDYARWKYGASKMGTNYRAVAAATLDSNGPLFADRPQLFAHEPAQLRETIPSPTGGWPDPLMQTNIFVRRPIGVGWGTTALTLSPVERMMLGIPPATGISSQSFPAVATYAEVTAALAANKLTRLLVPSGPAGLRIPRAGRAMLQRVGNPSDEVLADDQKRMAQYAALWEQYDAVPMKVTCKPVTGSPNPNCVSAPATLTGAAQRKLFERQLAALWMHEWRLGKAGCLADPAVVDPQQRWGNRCDWNYEAFVQEASSVFDKQIEGDLAACRAHVANNAARAQVAPSFTAVLSDPAKQALVYPCGERKNFTANAFDAATFFWLSSHETAGRTCEAARVNQSLEEARAAVRNKLGDVQFDGSRIYDEEGDSATLGSTKSFGADFGYSAKWELRKNAGGSDPLVACNFTGNTHQDLRASVYFFGATVPLVNLVGNGESVASPVADYDFKILDFDHLPPQRVVSSNGKKPARDGAPLTMVNSYLLGGQEYAMWFMLGPIPVKVTFGFAATAGIDYSYGGKAGNNCSSPAAPNGVIMRSRIAPWVRADAYATADVNLGVASAGLRLDLNLLTVSVPLDVSVTAETKDFRFKNGGDLAFELLRGKVSAYVSVGVSPFDVTYDATLFGWPGIGTSARLFGYEKNVSQADIGIALASNVGPNDVICSKLNGEWCGTIKDSENKDINSCGRASQGTGACSPAFPCRNAGSKWSCH